MDSPLANWFSALVTSAWMVFFVLLIWRRKKNTLSLPPGPPAWPLVGNLFQLTKKTNESFFALSRQYGPLMTVYLGMKPTVVVSSAAMAKEVLKTHDQIFSGRTIIQSVQTVSVHKSSIVWAQNGTYWRKLRRISNTELMSPKRLRALQHLRTDQVSEMIRFIYEERGTSVNIARTLIYTGLNLVGKMIFSTKVYDANNPDSVEFTNALSSWLKTVVKPNLADIFPFLRFLDLQGVRRDLTMYSKPVYKYLDEFINNRLARSSKEMGGHEREAEKDFLDVLLEMRSDDLSLIDIRYVIFELFMAGSDTTGSTVEWAMAELIRNPRIMKRAQQELEETVGRNRSVEESDIENLPYLHAVVKEIFRLHPVIPLLVPHRADRSCEIGGFIIPQHTQVIINVWALGRDPAVWKDPSKFMPERFLEGEKCKIEYKGQDFDLLPFGAGRRICMGLHLADKMVHIVLASLLHSFDWTVNEEMDMDDTLGLVLKKRAELKAIPTPRLNKNIY
ncbi:hypothetical protein KI387_026216 [Taxus chinensis]|uniref:Cytochrome P450 n=1 Tax=Taxus chinensis TaxID=29808 RepID=A0AA38L0P7_TAXCH|nr:hypothetical protein KI387_026216 [Taxus chinensis]